MLSGKSSKLIVTRVDRLNEQSGFERWRGRGVRVGVRGLPDWGRVIIGGGEGRSGERGRRIIDHR
jgi:hypothetical protein